MKNALRDMRDDILRWGVLGTLWRVLFAILFALFLSWDGRY